MNDRVQAVFHNVADLSLSERERYFVEEGIDEGTRREVEALLAFDSGASSRIGRDIREAVDRSIPQLEDGGSWRCGKYQVLKVIGRGGMGVVYLAERVDGEVRQQVAVKLLPWGAGDPQRERFLQERQILAALAHPNITRMLDAGHLANGQPYLVMEYVEGVPIDAFTAHTGIRPAIELFLKVCGAVAYLHRNLVVHRDLKPGNILVSADGEPKLLDFGIAKLLDFSTDTTATGLRALTPDYASPEQVTGGPLTTASDIYSLGAVLYRLLTGTPLRLFDSHSPEDIASIVATREPVRPSHRSHELKGDLDVILLKALRRDPQERYGTVDQFADDLTRYLRNEPITARADSLLYRARKFVVRHRAGMAAAVIAVVALTAGTGIALWQARESTRQRDLALAELRRAEATNDFSSYLLAEARPAAAKPLSNAQLLARGEALIAKRFTSSTNSDPALRIHLLLTLADRYFENQQFAERKRILQQAYTESRSLPDTGIRSLAACHWASQIAEGGDLKQAFRLFDEVLPVLVSEGKEFAAFESQCRVFESIASVQSSDLPRAIRAAEAALSLEEQRRGLPGRMEQAIGALANALSRAHRYQDASRAMERWAKLIEAEGRADDRIMAILLNNWGALMQNAGQMLRAVSLSERAIRVARAADSEQGPLPSMLSTYLRALSAVGDFAGIEPVIEETLKGSRSTGSASRHLTNLTFAIEAWCEAGNVKQAAALLSEAVSTLRAAPASSSSYLKGLVDLSASKVAIESGQPDRALELARRADTVLTPLNVSMEIVLARTLNATEHYREALPFAEKSVAAWRSRLGGFKHSYWLGKALLEAGSAHTGLGNSEAARKALNDSLEHTLATAGAKSRTAQRAKTLLQRFEASK